MLNDKIRIKGIEMQNRIISEPIVSDSGDNEGLPTLKTMEIYEAYANAGVGMLVMEQHAVHPWGRNKINQFRLYDDDSANAMEPLTKLFREKGIPIAAQLNFSGAGASGKALLNEPDFKLFSPSGLRTPRDLIQTDSLALEIDQINEIIQSFADAAKRAVELAQYSGGVQIYACHGYLIGQFLSPLTNIRTDEYGGTLENRARILFQITEAVKNAIGDFPVSVRLGASDQMPNEGEKGLTLKESVWIAEQLAKMGVDWIGVSGNHCIYGIGADDNDTAYFSPYAEAIRKAVEKYGVLVDCAGGIRTSKTAKRLIDSGTCDFVGIGRPLIKDKSYLLSWNL